MGTQVNAEDFVQAGKIFAKMSQAMKDALWVIANDVPREAYEPIKAQTEKALVTRGLIQGAALTMIGAYVADMVISERYQADEAEKLGRLGAAQYHADRHYAVACDADPKISASDSFPFMITEATMINAIMGEYEVTYDQAESMRHHMVAGDWDVKRAYGLMLEDQHANRVVDVEALFSAYEQLAYHDRMIDGPKWVKAWQTFGEAVHALYGVPHPFIGTLAALARHADLSIEETVEIFGDRREFARRVFAMGQDREAVKAAREDATQAYGDALDDGGESEPVRVEPMRPRRMPRKYKKAMKKARAVR